MCEPAQRDEIRANASPDNWEMRYRPNKPHCRNHVFGRLKLRESEGIQDEKRVQSNREEKNGICENALCADHETVQSTRQYNVNEYRRKMGKLVN